MSVSLNECQCIQNEFEMHCDSQVVIKNLWKMIKTNDLIDVGDPLINFAWLKMIDSKWIDCCIWCF